jgi:hypothetical protein
MSDETVTTEAVASGGGEAVSAPAIETPTTTAADISATTDTSAVAETSAPKSMEDTMRAVWKASQEAETPTTSAETPRDERGRFAPRNPETAAEAPLEATEAAPPAEPTTAVEPAPEVQLPDPHARWDEARKAKFATLTSKEARELALEIQAEHEANFTRATQQFAEYRKQADPYVQSIQPVSQLLVERAQQIGRHPSELVSNIVRTEYMLATGTPEQKAQALRQIIADYQVDAQSLFPQQHYADGSVVEQQQIDPHFANIQRQLAETQAHVQRLTGYLTQQQQAQAEAQRQAAEAEQAKLQSTIEDFKKDKPHFEKVRKLMSSLINSGEAQDLATAYDLATNAHPEIRQQIISDQLKAAEAKRKAEAEKHALEARKAAASNVKSEVGKPTPKTMDDTMRAAFRRASAA